MVITADELLQKPRPGNRRKINISPITFKSGHLWEWPQNDITQLPLHSWICMPSLVPDPDPPSLRLKLVAAVFPQSEYAEGWTCQERLRWRRHLVLFHLLCHGVSCPIPQPHIFPTLPFTIHVLVKRLPDEIFLLFCGPTKPLPSLLRRTMSKTGKASTSLQAENKFANLGFFTKYWGCKHHRFWME